jgi:type IV fimbrial biogenesis protein FimT
MTSPSRSGFTLIELLITIVVLMILLVMAVPSFVDTLERRRVINATQALSTHIQQARSVAVARNEAVSIVFRQTSTTDWCFGLTDGNDCDCTVANAAAPAACTVGVPDPASSDRVLIRTMSTSYPAVAFNVNSGTPLVVTFEPTRGIRIRNDGSVPPLETFSFTSPHGVNTRLDVSLIGRVSVCSPSGHTLHGGIKSC